MAQCRSKSGESKKKSAGKAGIKDFSPEPEVKAAIQAAIQSFLNIHEKNIEISDIKPVEKAVKYSMKEKKFRITVENRSYEVTVEELENKSIIGESTTGSSVSRRTLPELPPVRGAGLRKPDEMRVPIAGSVREVLVKAGDTVKKGDTVIILEAMKMYNRLEAPKDGKIAEVKVEVGTKMLPGDIILVYEKQ